MIWPPERGSDWNRYLTAFEMTRGNPGGNVCAKATDLSLYIFKALPDDFLRPECIIKREITFCERQGTDPLCDGIGGIAI